MKDEILEIIWEKTISKGEETLQAFWGNENSVIPEVRKELCLSRQ